VPASPVEIDGFLQAELVRCKLAEVTAVEAAAWLDEAGLLPDSPSRPGLPLRKLLRAGRIRSGEQRPPQKHGNWFIVRRGLEAPQTAGAPLRTRSRPETPIKRRPAVDGEGHRVTMEWMGEKIVTLEDLLLPALRVLCIGINPALTSVERGHYYQGRSGQSFLGRLRAVGLLPAYDGRWEDDVAFELGIGQTDIVKRPTAKAEAIGAAEFAYGKRALGKRLDGVQAALVIFTFKEAAKKLFGDFKGHGFISGFTLCGGEIFVMPGPYEKRDIADRSLSELRAWVKRDARRVP
jgi:TDG/mug DNA glycosylase family protein